MLPIGSHVLFEILQNLNQKEDSTQYNKMVRNCARYGIVYYPHDKFESFCPFCFFKQRPCHLKQRSFYSHAKKCDDCILFQKIINNMNNNILNLTAQFCSISNIYINSLCSAKFNEILRCANPFFRCIKRNDLRNKIFELFERIKYNITIQCNDKFCSILLDGSTRNNKNFYGFIIHTKSRLYYYKIESIEYASAENIALTTAEVINFINKETKLEVIGVCTDHAFNCIKAFNQSDQISAQIITQQFFEWIGCFSHLINLSICDLFGNSEFCELYQILNNILSISRQLKLRKKVPTFSKTRWNSYSKCLNFLNEVRSELVSFFNKNLQNFRNYIEILNSDEFNELTELFNYLNHLSSEIGGDNFLICNVYKNIIDFENFLSNLETADISFLGRLILERIYAADEYKIAVTAYFFTIEGKNHFLNIKDEIEREKIFTAIKEYIIYYNSYKFQFSEEVLEEQINFYINCQNFPYSDQFDLWEFYLSDEKMSALAEIAIRIISMPCSELPVERMFSHMKYLFGSKNYSQSEDLLNCQLGIRMDNVYSEEN